MMRHSHVSSRLLRLSLLWRFCVELSGVLGANVNVTVDDSDSSISYEPSRFWHVNSNSCPTCLHPDLSLAFNRTYHFGLHNLTLDADDFPSTSATTSAPAASSTHDDDDDDDDDDSNRGGSSKGKERRRFRDPTVSRRLDADDPGFVDTPVTAQFKFNGSAIYLFCLKPLGLPTSSQSPTAMNLTFTLDDAPSGTFLSSGSSSASGYASNFTVLSLQNLENKPHVLNITVGPNSVFPFDYIVYTTSGQNDSENSSTVFTTSAQSTNGAVSSATTALPDASPTTSSVSQRNVATFAAAVGTSVGVLGTLAFCIFLSICTRRRRAARRERRERALERGESDNSPPMIGPRPFVPRYFPGTVPAVPPPYTPLVPIDSSSSSRGSFEVSRSVYPPEVHTPLPVYIPRSQHDTSAPSDSPSYFDLPPSTPPPLDDVPLAVGLGAPPPFGLSLALPDRPIASEEAGSSQTESGTSGVSEDSHSHTDSDSGTTSSTVPPEDSRRPASPTPPIPNSTTASSNSREVPSSQSSEPH